MELVPGISVTSFDSHNTKVKDLIKALAVYFRDAKDLWILFCLIVFFDWCLLINSIFRISEPRKVYVCKYSYSKARAKYIFVLTSPQCQHSRGRILRTHSAAIKKTISAINN